MSLPKKLAFVDTETTGGSLRYGRVIEVGVLKIEDGQVVDTFSSLINPQCFVPEEIFKLTGINGASLEAAPTFREIYRDLQEILDGSVFVAHNVRFDYSFLKQEFLRVGQSFSPKHFCTVKLSRKLFPEHRHHNLDSILERFQIECQNRHRAFDDAKATFEFYSKAQKMVSEEVFLDAVNKISKKPTIPINLSPEVLENLPESPGVYIFYGDNGAVLYVGKSINIRDRVLSHFSSDHTSTKEMNISQQIKSIETIKTAGELGALIKESALVKKLQPLYNRKLRLSRKMVVLKVNKNSLGYEEVEFDQSGQINVEDVEKVVGVFRSKKQAKEHLVHLAREHNLCERLLGLENTKGACFAYRLGKCQGACVSKESVLKYNLKSMVAFSSSKIRKWPYDGPVTIKEVDPFTGQGEVFLIDKWCFLGSGTDASTLSNEYLFDLDTYKILNSYLRATKNQKNISSLKTGKNNSEINYGKNFEKDFEYEAVFD